MTGNLSASILARLLTLAKQRGDDYSLLLNRFGMERLLVTPLSRFPQGKPITLNEGILFLTYATLRSDDRGTRLSRVKQSVEWLGNHP